MPSPKEKRKHERQHRSMNKQKCSGSSSVYRIQPFFTSYSICTAAAFKNSVYVQIWWNKSKKKKKKNGQKAVKKKNKLGWLWLIIKSLTERWCSSVTKRHVSVRKALVQQRLHAFRCRSGLALPLLIWTPHSPEGRGFKIKNKHFGGKSGDASEPSRPPHVVLLKQHFPPSRKNGLGAAFRVTPRSKNKTLTFLPVSRSARHIRWGRASLWKGGNTERTL